MQRACAAALIRKGKSVLFNPGRSADDLAALDIIQQLGAKVEAGEDKVTINGNGISPVSGTIHCGESGLSIRMFTSIAALSEKEIAITGGGSLKKRPMNFFDQVLPQLGVSVRSENGYLPLHVKGPLQARDITVDGSLSSQYLTGLLFAYSAAEAKDVSIHVKDLASKPYIDLTLDVLKAFSLKLPVNKDHETYYFDSEVTTQPSIIKYTIEGDWSGAAFLLVAGAVAGNIIVKGLDVFSSQADKAILQALAQTQAIMSVEDKQISVKKSKLQPFHFNATDCPDLFPPLVALAAYCEGTSVIEGVSRLKHKESDRGVTLQEEFGKMGVEVVLQDDIMTIKGGGRINSADTDSHNDHRIAMACAVAALGAEGPVKVDHAEAINKSYPHFWNDLEKAGASISLINN
jgi:3-phosphoshikimate 1-carboxyvinyltransferase